MIKKITSLLGAVAVLGLVAVSCTKDSNPYGAQADTNMSIWTKIISPDTLPDTLLYGNNISFQLCVGDSDGDKPTVTVTGLPLSMTRITTSGDTAFAFLTIKADSLVCDSLYNINIKSTGVAAVDTVTLTYSMFVTDTNRIGGMRKLTVGMWWTTTQNDTLVSYKDSLATLDIKKSNEEHRLLTKVLDTMTFNGTLFYKLEQKDTNITNGNKVTRTTSYVSHTKEAVNVISELSLWAIDSITATSFKLPLSIGSTWSMAQRAKDTTVDWKLGALTIPLKVFYELTAPASVLGKETYSFAGANRSCFRISQTPQLISSMLTDKDIVYADTLAKKGDTLTLSKIKSSSQLLVSNELGATFFSSEVVAKFDTNYINNVTVRDTTRKGSILTRLYDPRRGGVLQ